MPRIPIVILNVTVFDGTVLFLAPKASLQFKCGVLDEYFVLPDRTFRTVAAPGINDIGMRS
jgi:hypothetical protein